METKEPATQPQSILIKFDEKDLLKIAALCFAVSVLGCLCAIWLTKKRS